MKGQATNSSGFVTSTHVQPSTYTSVLSVIISGGKGSSTPPRSDIYSAALAPARDQGFVDRSEDMIIEQAPPVMFVRPMIAVSDTSRAASHHSNFSIQTNSVSRGNDSYQSNLTVMKGEIPSVRYTTDAETISFRRSSSSEKGDKFSSQRKTSLQMTPDSRKKNDFGYSRLETYASETNIDGTLTRNLSARKTDKNSSKFVQSRDDLYESTVTVTSNIDSVDNSLFSLTEEAARGVSTQGALSASNDSLGLFNVSSGTPEAHIYLEFQNEQPTSTQDAVYAKVNKSQKEKQKSFQTSTDEVNIGETGEGFELKENKYTVTCTAELKHNENGTKLTETCLDMEESAMSFDDTIKAFENFKDLDFGSEEKSAEFSESQTERAENVIEYEPPKVTRRKTDDVTSTDNTQVTGTDTWFTVSGSGESSVSTCSTSQTKAVITTEQQKKQQAEVTHMTVTTTTNIANASNGAVFNVDMLEDELDRSVNALLIGMDVDTAQWAAIKDKSSDSDNDTFEVYKAS